MNSSKILHDVKQQFQQKRLKAEEECNELITKLCEDEELHNLYTSYTSTQLKIMRTQLDAEKEKLQKEVNRLQTQLNKMLKPKNLQVNQLVPQYECKLCNDTGVYNGKLCNCIKKELSARKNALLNSRAGFKTFADCKDSVMNENDKKVCEVLKKWCNSYPDINKININLLGAPGTGKTFLLECVTSELIAREHQVCFKTAFEVNEQARAYHMGKSFDYSDLLDAEVLVVDDLGSEPMLKNVTKEYLYNLINTRQVNGKATLISSNLSLNDLLDRYDERIFSRLANKALSININLTGSDKRIN